MYIYKITNKINNKAYTGQTTVSIKQRWKEHCRNKVNLISKAINKYGSDNFTIKEIGGANSLSELNYLETCYIYKYNSLVPNGYNLSSGGGNKEVHKETRRKISIATKGKKLTDKHIKLLIAAHSIEVFQYSLNGFFIKKWKSASEATKLLNIDNSEIGKCCKNKRKSCGGFMWSYIKRKQIKPYSRKKPVFTKRCGPPSKKVGLLDANKKIIKTYNSLTEAAIENNCDISVVSKVCRGIYEKTKGLSFIYIY